MKKQKKIRMLVLNVKISGINKFFLGELEKKGIELIIFEVPFPKICKYIAAIVTINFNKNKWRKNYYKFLGKLYRTSWVFKRRSKYCQDKHKELEGQYDIIFQLSGMFAPSLELEKLSVPYVTFHDYTMKLADKFEEWLPFKHEYQSWLKLEKKLYSHARVIFTTNENARQSIINDYDINQERVVKVAYGLNFDQIPNFTKEYDGKSILFVGIDFERKGGYVLLKAFSEVKQTIPDAQLYIVGPAKETINTNIEGVTLIGQEKDREKVKALFKQASVFVLPSLCEPFGLVFLEAMAFNVPCIGSNIDAMPEIIKEEETGFLVEPNNPHDLAEKIIKVLKNPLLAKKMGNKAKEEVTTKYLWEKIVNEIFHYVISTTNNKPLT